MRKTFRKRYINKYLFWFHINFSGNNPSKIFRRTNNLEIHCVHLYLKDWKKKITIAVKEELEDHSK